MNYKNIYDALIKKCKENKYKGIYYENLKWDVILKKL